MISLLVTVRLFCCITGESWFRIVRGSVDIPFYSAIKPFGRGAILTVYVLHPIAYLAALPTNPPECSHRVWSSREGCSGMQHDAITLMVYKQKGLLNSKLTSSVIPLITPAFRPWAVSSVCAPYPTPVRSVWLTTALCWPSAKGSRSHLSLNRLPGCLLSWNSCSQDKR